jgi:hypothetical protein
LLPARYGSDLDELVAVFATAGPQTSTAAETSVALVITVP